SASESLARMIADLEQPAIARASALALMAENPGSAIILSVRDGVRDSSPLVRRAAARALAYSDPRVSANTLSPLLNDRVGAVRVEAAETLTGASLDTMPDGAAQAFKRAVGEYIATQELNADRPESHVNLALLFIREKRTAEAKSQLMTALSLDPSFAPAAV